MTSLSENGAAYVADRARVWEARRFCQVLPSTAQYARGKDPFAPSAPLRQQQQQQSTSDIDGALSGLLRCIVHEVRAEIAMVSLLDDHTQYFISGSTLVELHNAAITMESTRWYGCESVNHHGGLCEQTITMQNTPVEQAFYEVCDLAKHEHTRHLPFVNGETANFRHYFGVPLDPYGRHNVGTVFFFRNEPSATGLSVSERSYMCEVSVHITKHLERAVEALEGRRVLKFNQGIASLLSANGEGTPPTKPDGLSSPDEPIISNQHPPSILQTYQLAAKLLCNIFKFDGVKIQEVGLTPDLVNHNPNFNGSNLLAQYSKPGLEELSNLPSSLIHRLLRVFPSGSIFQISPETYEVAVALRTGQVVSMTDQKLIADTLKAFPQTRQIMLMPLWDSHHERNIGAMIGLAQGFLEVYLGSNDLSSMSAFSATLMMQVRRLEVLAVDKVKSDFLGSISHELRTPVHGIMASIDLLSELPCTEQQRDLLETARYSSLSLLNTVNSVLDYSNINSAAQPSREGLVPPHRRSERQSFQIANCVANSPGASLMDMAELSIIHACEDTMHRAIEMMHLGNRVVTETPVLREAFAGEGHASSPTKRRDSQLACPLLTFDSNAAVLSSCKAGTYFPVVLGNLLNNALKFTDPSGCVRATLESDGTSVKLSIVDSGKGMALHYARLQLSIPFSQEDPITTGTGLGFFLAKQAATSLSGDVRVESDKALGTTVTASFPLDRLVRIHSEDLSEEHSALASDDANLQAVQLPRIKASLLVPERWQTGDLLRGRRCTEALLASLSRTLREWSEADVVAWEPSEEAPALMFLAEDDWERMTQTSSGFFEHTKTIVLYSGLTGGLDKQVEPVSERVRIDGPITSLKVQSALARLYPDFVPKPRERSTRAEASYVTKTDTPQDDGKADEALSAEIVNQINELELQTGVGDCPTSPGHGGNPLAQTPVPVPKVEERMPTPPAVSEPRALLVDDNAINLKVLGKYLLKASKRAAFSVSGGQEAITAFYESMAEASEASQRFDIIFLDLSMPDVSGFDVAKAIREFESSRESVSRTFICALTGLVSAKDRNAAYAAGVDEYLVKPAGLREVQDVIERWRNRSISLSE